MGDAYEIFTKYYNSLPKIASLCRIFERNESYFVYGDNATLTCKHLKAGVTRSTDSSTDKSGTDQRGIDLSDSDASDTDTPEEEPLPYVKIPKNSLVDTLKFLLFQRHCSVEMLKNSGNAKSLDWNVVAKASPGNTIAFEDILFSKDNSYMMEQRGIIAIKVTTSSLDLIVGLAYCDPVLREFHVCEFQDSSDFSILQSVLVQLSPHECLLPVSLAKNSESAPGTIKSIVETHKIAVTECKSDVFEALNTSDVLRLFLPAPELEYNFEDWQSTNKGCSLAATIKYLELLSDENNFEQYKLIEFSLNLYAKIDKVCAVGLGLIAERESVEDVNEKDYLFGFLNSCRTSGGARLLMQFIKQPLIDPSKINERLDLVEIFVNDRTLTLETQHFLDKFIDLDLLSRKIQRRVINLQDFYKLHQMLTKVPLLQELFSQYSGDHSVLLDQLFTTPLKEKVEELSKLREMIDDTLDFEAIDNKEFVIKPDFDARLQEMRTEMTTLYKSMQSELESTKDDLNLPSVKLEIYEKSGYAFRITLKEESNLRNKKKYIVLNTGNSGVKFQTPALSRMSDNYSSLKKEYEDIQKGIVAEMISVAVPYTPSLKSMCSLLSWVDVTVSLASKAANACKTYIRPIINKKDSFYTSLQEMRHPVLEEKLRDFIPNSVELSAEGKHFYFVSGPNMGGKSTYIRSVGLNVLLAQMGSFVPCSSAEISICDAIYTRIGASDNPAGGVSTFMLEMLEMQRMLKNATPNSLLIIDELGRGTSTADGFGLSYSMSCHIANKLKSPCLFATHFHELTSLSEKIASIGNLRVEALQSEEELTFLYKVKPGVCTKSFGIHVAQMSHFPEKVIKNAYAKLEELEGNCMTYEELSETFSRVPKGKNMLPYLKSVLPFKSNVENGFHNSSKPSDSVEPMEVEESTNGMNGHLEASEIFLSLESNFDIEKAKQLLSALEEMEKELS